MINKLRKKLRLFLKESKLKITEERIEILDAILESSGKSNKSHFTADDIFISARKLKHQYSQATIYRNIKLFCDGNIIQETQSRNNFKAYEITLSEHHDHLLCLECGEVISFFNKEIEKIQMEICKKYKFKQKEHHLSIKGLCDKCQNPEE